MQADFRPPKRRCRIFEEYEGPLPVSRSRSPAGSQSPTESRSPEGSQSPTESCVFRAELINQHVVVCHPEHIQKIHNQGYLGKGVLSRARPDHSISTHWKHHEGFFLPVITRSRYKDLLNWVEAILSAQGLDQQAVTQAMLSLSEPVNMEDLRPEDGDAKPAGGSEMESEDTRSSDQDPDWEPEPDPDPCVSVPGPGFVLVSSDVKQGGDDELRRSPLALTEYLQLSLEETFFLVYSLGCLCVYLDQEPLSILQLWTKLRSLRPDFVSSFAAYQHFRSKGWIPKGGSGAKYGVDFLLYRKGPPFYHASYSVVVERADHEYGGPGLRPFSWRSLAALSRITANVSKELMLCYIIYPADLSEDELNSPECLSRLQVQEVIVSRWVSSRERVEQDDI